MEQIDGLEGFEWSDQAALPINLSGTSAEIAWLGHSPETP
jgi:hypothetical protein